MTPDQITEARALVERIKFEAVNSEIDRQLAGSIIVALTAALDEIERLREALEGLIGPYWADAWEGSDQ